MRRVSYRRGAQLRPFGPRVEDGPLLELELGRSCDGRRSGGRAEVREDVRRVAVHGVLAEDERLRDLRVGAARRYEREDFPLAWAQLSARGECGRAALLSGCAQGGESLSGALGLGARGVSAAERL